MSYSEIIFAGILGCFVELDESKSDERETVTGLRQPEVSIAMRWLKERDWINEGEEKKTGKGRPFKIYSLKTGFDDIIAQLEKKQKKVIDELQERIKRLKKSG